MAEIDRSKLVVERASPDAAVLGALARLRIAVFRDWPYIYDGSLAYERSYLAAFLADPAAVVIVASIGGEPVGMATASPLAGQPDAIAAPLARHGLPVDGTFYFGESVLLAEARGLGIGHAFFDQREAAARSAGATHAAFCAVVREPGHPLAPADPRDLAPFWRRRGYAPLAGVTAPMEWKDRDQPRSTVHTMQFWARAL